MSAAAFAACVVSAIVAARIGYVSTAESQMEIASQGLSSFASALDSLLARHESMPRLLALDPRLAEVLMDPTSVELKRSANAFLENVAQHGGVAAAFVVDAKGLAIASSNWNTPQSFVGRNYSFRPYFHQAMAGEMGRFYAIGANTNEPGYFLAWALQSGGKTLGEVIVKIDMRRLQTSSSRGETVAVADEYGVIFLASDPSLRYRPIAPLSPDARATLEANQAYANEPLLPLHPDAPPQTIPADFRVASGRTMRTVSQTIAPMGWRVFTLVDMSPARRAAAAAAAGGGSAAALLFALVAFGVLRRQRSAEAERSHDEIYRSQQRLRAVADSLPLMVCFVDKDRRLVFANNAYAQHHGRTVETIEGRPITEVLPDEERAFIAPYATRAWAGETVTFDRELRSQRGFRIFEATYRPEWNAAKTEVIGLHAMMLDVTETRRRLDELARLSLLDHLTQLLNRQGFDARLSQALASAGDGKWVALLFIDLDDFKQVNDRHGHPVGDALLQAFSKRLARLVREHDSVARLGGDEFALVLPGIAGPDIAERLADAVAQMASTPFELGGVVLRASASIGVAITPSPMDADSFCKRADDALYAYKRLAKRLSAGRL